MAPVTSSRGADPVLCLTVLCLTVLCLTLLYLTLY